MRVAIDARFLTHPQPGGFKTYTENLVAALSELGGDVEYVLYLDREPDLDTRLPLKNCTYRVVLGGRLPLSVPLREQIALPRQIERDRPDLVHFLCNTAPVNLRRAYVVTLHDTIQVDDPEPLRASPRLADQWRWAMAVYSRWAIRRSLPRAARIATVSQFEKVRIERLFNLPPKVVSVTYPAPTAVFRPLAAETRSDRQRALAAEIGLPPRFVLGVGHEPRKNIRLLVEAFAVLATTRRDVWLVVVVCDESRREEIDRLVRRRGLGDRALVLGRVLPGLLAELYGLAEVFAYPSLHEGFGLPPLEAMACGTPTVAMRRTSLPEVLGDGALFVDSDDPAAWAAALQNVLASESLRRELSARGLARASEFTWKRCAEETLALYQGLCHEPRSPRRP